jgi:DNA-binding SARP family transcriptional activator
MLSVELLGVFRIANVEARYWSELGSAGRSFASYLFAYPDRPHRRERLSYLFWPDLDEDRARSAMNSAVWRIRRIFSCVPESAAKQTLKTIGPEILLERADWLDVDALALQRAAAMVVREPAALMDTAVLDEVVTALTRYQGPFLDGDEGDWILEEREKLHSRFLRTSIQAVFQLGERRRYSDAIDLACLALNFDPYREELVRLFLGLLTLNEERARAIRHYDSWSKSLANELSIAPLPATRALVEQIKILNSDGEFQTLRARLFGS